MAFAATFRRSLNGPCRAELPDVLSAVEALKIALASVVKILAFLA
jgi:hypothetical protein